MRVICILSFLVSFILVHAEERSSDTYRIISDSINIGGVFSTSTNYREEDTIGEMGTGISTSTNFTLLAGYQHMQTGDIFLTPGNDVVMFSFIGGITGGTSNGSTTFNVTTSNEAGYTVTIKASSSPALVSGSNNIADYTPAGANPDYDFTFAVDASEFGFSPEGTDIDSRYKDNGSACNTGSGSTADTCWDPLSMTPRTIVQRFSPTDPSGTETTVKFRVGVGSSKFQAEGVYIATTTITVLPI